MFAKKIWIPILLVLIGFAIGGTFVGRHIASHQEPVKVINVVTPEPVDRSQPTQAETQSAPAAEGGHWHGDEWHADPHEPAPVETLAPVNELQQDVDIPVEDTTSVSDRLTLGQILAERGTDIYNIDLNEVPPDLRRKVQYFREKKVWSEKWEKANTDWFQAGKNLDNIGPRDAEEYTKYIRSLSETEKREHTARLKDALEKYRAASETLDAISQEEPIYPNEEN